MIEKNYKAKIKILPNRILISAPANNIQEANKAMQKLVKNLEKKISKIILNTSDKINALYKIGFHDLEKRFNVIIKKFGADISNDDNSGSINQSPA